MVRGLVPGWLVARVQLELTLVQVAQVDRGDTGARKGHSGQYTTDKLLYHNALYILGE